MPFTDTAFTEVLGLLTLVVGAPLNALAVVLLRRKSRERPDLRVLRDRYLVAVVTTVVVLFFGIIFVNNDRAVPWLGLDTTKWITRLAMLGLAVIPALGWLTLYYKPRD